MRYFNGFLFLLLIHILNGCIVLHSGSVSGGPVLNKGDKYVDIAKGSAKTVFVFGIGDLEKEELVQKAKLNMYLNRPLNKDEFYANFTTSITNKLIFILVHITRISVSAEVVKSGDTIMDTTKNAFQQKIQTIEKLRIKKPGTIQFDKRENGKILLVGDSVYYAYNTKEYKLYVVSNVDKETVLLLATEKEDKNTLTSLKNTFFIKNLSLNEFKSGDRVSAEILDAHNSTKYVDAIVQGTSEGFVLVATKNTFYVLPVVKLKKIK